MSEFKVEDLTLEEAQKIVDDAPIDATHYMTGIHGKGYAVKKINETYEDANDHSCVFIGSVWNKTKLDDVKARIERLKKQPKKHATVKDLTLDQAKEIILNADWRDRWYSEDKVFADGRSYSDMSQERADMLFLNNGIELLNLQEVQEHINSFLNPTEEKGNPKYDKTIHGKYTSGKCVADVYCVLDAFEVTNPQLQHLTKKALNAGQRGHKTMEQDLIDIRDSAQSALDMFYSKKGE